MQSNTELVLTWHDGHIHRWPGTNVEDAARQHRRIRLDPIQMRRLEVRTPCGAKLALWDANWPEQTRNDLLKAYS